MRVSRKPPPNHVNSAFWPEVEEKVAALARKDKLLATAEFKAWWDKLRSAAGNAHAYSTKGNPEQVAATIVAEYRRRATRDPAATR